MSGEKPYENRIKKFLKKEECWCLKYWAGGGFTRSGIPDLLICCNGHFIGAEVKGADGRPSALQIRELKKIQEAGGIGILLFPNDYIIFCDLIRYLKEGNLRQADLCIEELEYNVEEWRKKLNETDC